VDTELRAEWASPTPWLNIVWTGTVRPSDRQDVLQGMFTARTNAVQDGTLARISKLLSQRLGRYSVKRSVASLCCAGLFKLIRDVRSPCLWVTCTPPSDAFMVFAIGSVFRKHDGRMSVGLARRLR